MTVQLTQAVRIAGVATASGSTVTLTPQQEIPLVNQRVAVWVGANLGSGWVTVRPWFRLIISGTGTVHVDARDFDGNVVTVDTYTVSSANRVVEFPYPGDRSNEIRLTPSSGVSVEVMQ